MSTGSGVVCTADAEYKRVVNQLRQAMPRSSNYTITAAVFSVGAYGAFGPFRDSQPNSSNYLGLSVNMLAAVRSGAGGLGRKLRKRAALQRAAVAMPARGRPQHAWRVRLIGSWCPSWAWAWARISAGGPEARHAASHGVR